MSRRLAATALVTFTLALLFAAAAPATATEHNYLHIHIHLNAYDHWGYCSQGGFAKDEPYSDTFQASCTGKHGGEIGLLAQREHFLAHGSYCFWSWAGDHLTVKGRDPWGGEWWLEGLKDPKWTHFVVRDGQIAHLRLVTDDLVPGFGFKGGKGNPLAVDMSKHVYYVGATKHWGYSLDLVGYVRVL